MSTKIGIDIEMMNVNNERSTIYEFYVTKLSAFTRPTVDRSKDRY